MVTVIDAHESRYIDTIRELFIEYSKDINEDLCFQSFEQELRDLPGKYSPPAGCLLLAFVDGEAVGCIALRPIGEGICEMKRLYVKPAFRGLHLGRILSETIIARAKQLGYTLMKLDTLEALGPAVHLYETLGFARTEPYCCNPLEGVVYMELHLAKN